MAFSLKKPFDLKHILQCFANILKILAKKYFFFFSYTFWRLYCETLQMLDIERMGQASQFKQRHFQMIEMTKALAGSSVLIPWN